MALFVEQWTYAREEEYPRIMPKNPSLVSPNGVRPQVFVLGDVT